MRPASHKSYYYTSPLSRHHGGSILYGSLVSQGFALGTNSQTYRLSFHEPESLFNWMKVLKCTQTICLPESVSKISQIVNRLQLAEAYALLFENALCEELFCNIYL